MHYFHNQSSLLTMALTLTLALPTLAHPIIHPTPKSAIPAAQNQQPLQDHERQLLLIQKLDTQRLVIGRPERETVGWSSAGGVREGEESAQDGDEGVWVMEGEVVDEEEDGEEGEEVEVECGEVDEDEDEDGGEEEDEECEDEEVGQVEL